MEILLIEFLLVLKCITNSLQKIVFAAVDSTEIKNPLEANFSDTLMLIYFKGIKSLSQTQIFPYIFPT